MKSKIKAKQKGQGEGRKAAWRSLHQFVSASQIWELAEGKTNTMELAEAVDNSDLEAFGFTDDFIFELWGAITDAKSGRAKKEGNNNF